MAVQTSTINVHGSDIAFSIESGVVAGVRRLSETRVEGNVSQGSGHISSRVHRTTEFSLIDLNGVERPHWFSSHEMFLRDGHRVSLVYAQYRQGMWAFLVNHDTQQYLNIWEPTAFVYHIGLVKPVGCVSYFITIVSCIALGVFLPDAIDFSGSLLIFTIAGLIVVSIVQWWRATSIWTKHLLPEFHRQIQFCFDVLTKIHNAQEL